MVKMRLPPWLPQVVRLPQAGCQVATKVATKKPLIIRHLTNLTTYSNLYIETIKSLANVMAATGAHVYTSTRARKARLEHGRGCA